MDAGNDNFGNLPAELQYRTFEFVSLSLMVLRLTILFADWMHLTSS